MPAPTIAARREAPANNPDQGQQRHVPMIPFTRAARKKRRQVVQLGPTALQAGQVQLNPLQIPAAGYLRKLVLDVTGTSAGNNATVAYANDGPFSVLGQVSLLAANGDSLINPIDGFALAMVNKYGAHAGSRDPLIDPNYSKTAGSGASAGSFHFQLDVPVEYDARDACCALPNMAANQSFLLNLFLAPLATLYTTAPTNAPTVTITVTMYYWAAPDEHNAHGVPQQHRPRVRNAVSLLQVYTPGIVAGTDQVVGPFPNTGNVVRYFLAILRNGSGVRTEADWPNVTQFSVNNDPYLWLTKNNWRRDMADEYGLNGGITATPTLGALDNGVYVVTDFMNDGSEGSGRVSSSANRDLMLVTSSGTALDLEAQNWGASAASLQVVTHALRIPDATAFYAPFGI